MESIKELLYKKVAVIGYGTTGKAASRYFLAHGSEVTVYDGKEVEEKIADVTYVASETFENLESFDLILLSPGVSYHKEEIQKAKEAGVVIHNDITFFLDYVSNRAITIGVTGSNGKSTTVSMLQEALSKTRYNAYLGGNIGTSPFTWLLEDIVLDDAIFILEISSYQLEVFDGHHGVNVALFTSFSDNHLTRHQGSMDVYADEKVKIIDSDLTKVVVNYDSAGVREYIVPRISFDHYGVSFEKQNIAEQIVLGGGVATLYREEKERVLTEKLETATLTERHNTLNIGMCLAVLEYLGEVNETSVEALLSFSGLKYRYEHLGEIDGITYINDSKSTTPEATLVALRSLQDTCVLIAGGGAKGVTYEVLTEVMGEKVRKLILLPGDARESLQDVAAAAGVETIEVEKLPEALEVAHANMGDAQTILFSPGATSFYGWNGFEERGESFEELVRELK